MQYVNSIAVKHRVLGITRCPRWWRTLKVSLRSAYRGGARTSKLFAKSWWYFSIRAYSTQYTSISVCIAGYYCAVLNCIGEYRNFFGRLFTWKEALELVPSSSDNWRVLKKSPKSSSSPSAVCRIRNYWAISALWLRLFHLSRTLRAYLACAEYFEATCRCVTTLLKELEEYTFVHDDGSRGCRGAGCTGCGCLAE